MFKKSFFRMLSNSFVIDIQSKTKYDVNVIHDKTYLNVNGLPLDNPFLLSGLVSSLNETRDGTRSRSQTRRDDRHVF